MYMTSLGSAQVDFLGPGSSQFKLPTLQKSRDVWGPEPLLLQHARTTGVRKALDLGCGQGWLSVYLASLGIEVVAADLNPAAVEVTRENSRSGGVPNLVRPVLSDLFSEVPDTDFDTIISYPPQGSGPVETMMERSRNDPDRVFMNGLFAGAASHLIPSGTLQVLFVDRLYFPKPSAVAASGLILEQTDVIPMVALPFAGSEQSYYYFHIYRRK